MVVVKYEVIMVAVHSHAQRCKNLAKQKLSELLSVAVESVHDP